MDPSHGHAPAHALVTLSERFTQAKATIPGSKKAYTIGPFINRDMVNKPKSHHRSRKFQTSPLRIFCQISRPAKKMDNANSMSVVTKVARRALSRFKPKAPKEIKPAVRP